MAENESKNYNSQLDSMNPLYDIHKTNGNEENKNNKTDTHNTMHDRCDKDDNPPDHMPKEEELENENMIVDTGLPRVNCPEKIIICLDNSLEMTKPTFQSRTGDKYAPMMLIKRALGIFLHSKHRLNSRHEFALVWLKESAYWICDFTSDPGRILTLINNCNDAFETENCEFSSLFDAIKDHVNLPHVDNPETNSPPYIVRTLIVYGRSHCVPYSENSEALRLLYTSPYFFVDAYYIHEPVSKSNNCEEIFDVLCKLDEKGLSYIFEVSRNPTKLYDCMAQLLGHPLQRPLQSKLYHSIQPKQELT